MNKPNHGFELLVEKIISHRISIEKDKYEYQIKIRNTNSLPWVSEHFLSGKESTMLINYKQINDLTDIEVSQICNDETFDGIDNSRHIVFDFNEKFGIKLEIGIIEEIGNENLSEVMPDTQQSNVNVKLENVESTDLEQKNSDNHISNEGHVENVMKQKINNQKNNNNVVKEIDKIMDTSNNKSITDNSDKNLLLHKQKSLLKKKKQNENSKTLKQKSKPTENKMDLVPNLPSTDITNNGEKNNDQITLEPLLKNPQDNFDIIFSKLPRGKKISFECRGSTIDSNLKPLSDIYLKMLVENGEIDVLQSYIFGNCKEKLQTAIINNQCLLVLAAQLNHVHIVVLFLSLGVDINVKDSNSNTALICACENENEMLIDLLINNGADANMKRDGSNNILFKCIAKNKLRAVSTLLNLGVNSAQIRLESPVSMEDYVKQMKLEELSNIVGRHNFYIYKEITDLVSSYLGPNIKLVKRIMPIFVLSQNDIHQNNYQLIFDCDVPPVKPNHFTMLSLVTGLVLGNGLKFMINDIHKINLLRLNNFEQKSFLPDGNYLFTSFSPLKPEQNSLTIRSYPAKCKKVRLILVAYEVSIIE